MSLTRFARALLPDQWSACGAVLRPFCIGHALLLHRVGNACLAAFTPEADREGNSLPRIGAGDVMVAAWICSRPVAEAHRGLDSWRMKMWLRWKRIMRGVATAEDQLRLLKYLEASHQYPPVKLVREVKGEPCGAPWLAVLVTTLMHRYGISPAEALATPLATAHWLHALALEQEGAWKIRNGADDALEAGADAMIQKIEQDPAAIAALVENARRDAGLTSEETPL